MGGCLSQIVSFAVSVSNSTCLSSQMSHFVVKRLHFGQIDFCVGSRAFDNSRPTNRVEQMTVISMANECDLRMFTTSDGTLAHYRRRTITCDEYPECSTNVNDNLLYKKSMSNSSSSGTPLVVAAGAGRADIVERLHKVGMEKPLHQLKLMN